MNIIEAPKRWSRTGRSIFLAGGITDCPDWQADAINLLEEGISPYFRLDVLNPRRANFPIHDPDAAEEQIAWEFDKLTKVSHILFWFPKDTLCPIVLYELGFLMGRKWTEDDQSTPSVSIGCDPKYERRQDVEIQVKLATGTSKIFDTVEETVQDTIQIVKNDWHFRTNG